MSTTDFFKKEDNKEVFRIFNQKLDELTPSTASSSFDPVPPLKAFVMAIMQTPIADLFDINCDVSIGLIGNQFIAVKFPGPSRLPEIFYFQLKTLPVNNDIAFRIKQIDHDRSQKRLIIGIVNLQFGKKEFTAQNKAPAFYHTLSFGANQTFPNDRPNSFGSMHDFKLVL